jgi:hypothetical protein
MIRRKALAEWAGKEIDLGRYAGHAPLEKESNPR